MNRTLITSYLDAHKSIEKLKGELTGYHAFLLKERDSIEAKFLDGYHMLELLKLNVVEIMKVALFLRNVLRQRREIKEQIIIVQNLIQSKDPESILEQSRLRVAKYKLQSSISYKQHFGISK